MNAQLRDAHDGNGPPDEVETDFTELRAELMQRRAFVMEALGELPESFAVLVNAGDAIGVMVEIHAAVARYADWMIARTLTEPRGDELQAVTRLLGVYAEPSL